MINEGGVIAGEAPLVGVAAVAEDRALRGLAAAVRGQRDARSGNVCGRVDARENCSRAGIRILLARVFEPHRVTHGGQTGGAWDRVVALFRQCLCVVSGDAAELAAGIGRLAVGPDGACREIDIAGDAHGHLLLDRGGRGVDGQLLRCPSADVSIETYRVLSGPIAAPIRSWMIDDRSGHAPRLPGRRWPQVQSAGCA